MHLIFSETKMVKMLRKSRCKFMPLLKYLWYCFTVKCIKITHITPTVLLYYCNRKSTKNGEYLMIAYQTSALPLPFWAMLKLKVWLLSNLGHYVTCSFLHIPIVLSSHCHTSLLLFFLGYLYEHVHWLLWQSTPFSEECLFFCFSVLLNNLTLT